MARTRKPAATKPPEPIEPKTAKAHRAALVKLIQEASHRSDYRRVFSDFVEMSAISISNAVDARYRDFREKRYMEIVKTYSPETLALFPKMLGELIMALEVEPHDALGMIYGEMEISNKHTGQFFTPYELCRMMARMTIDDTMKEKIAATGYFTVQEPAVGAGATIIALAQELRADEINYQKSMHVVGIDVDLKCVHMCYLQFALLNIPAIVFHGNTLSMEMYSEWATPAHIMGGWWHRINRKQKEDVQPHPDEQAA